MVNIDKLFTNNIMKFISIIIVLVSFLGCQLSTEKRTPTCKVKAELLLPRSYGDSLEVKDIFKKRLNILYPQAIENATRRNGIDADSDAFSFEIEEPKHTDRIVYFYLTGYIDCNCINLLDTLMVELRSAFLNKFPDKRTVEYQSTMLSIADQMDSLELKIKEIENRAYNINQKINLDSIHQMEEEWFKLVKQRELLYIENASYLYEFFTVLNAGSSVL